MQILSSHDVDRSSGVSRSGNQHSRPPDSETFRPTGRIVEFRNFKKIAQAADEALRSKSDDRDGLPMDLATSLLEELQQARFREARRLKRLETLEREVKAARAEANALRSALVKARCGSAETVTEGAPVIGLGLGRDQVRYNAMTLCSRKIRRFWGRLLRSRG